MPLPVDTTPFTEPDSVNLLQRIQAHPVPTTLRGAPISTTFVHWPCPSPQDAPPFLLIHGFDSSVVEFRRLMPLLARHRDVWAIDLLSFGFTERPQDVPYTAASLNAHLYAAWKTLIGQPVVIVGASMGGAAALDLALTHPEVATSLVLLDSAGPARGPNLSRFLPPGVGQLAAEVLRNPQVRQRISRQAYCDPSFASADAARCAALHLACPNWRRALAAFTRSGGYNVLTRQQIAQVNQPTLLVWGENDAILGTALAAQLRDLIPNSELRWVERCGHVPHLEQPKATAELITAWMK
ncbi:MAG: alpha/beta hydrolase [Cyanobacteria bacterium P01_A01_bin.135]